MSRNCSRSLSSANEYPHDSSPRTECPALSGTTLVCMRILMSNFNSLSEDHQDLANKFPKKTEGFGRVQAEFFHCNGMLKATKKSFLCYIQNIFRLRLLIILYSP